MSHLKKEIKPTPEKSDTVYQICLSQWTMPNVTVGFKIRKQYI
jgi:hypothetical protein